MSLICTSIASKPALSKAAAISICPLMPCSRRTAILGLTPVVIYGATIDSLTSNVVLNTNPLVFSLTESNSCLAQFGLSLSFATSYEVFDHSDCRVDLL